MGVEPTILAAKDRINGFEGHEDHRAPDDGGARGPVVLVAFKAIDSGLRGQNGGFDSHTLPPPTYFAITYKRFLVLIPLLVLIAQSFP